MNGFQDGIQTARSVAKASLVKAENILRVLPLDDSGRLKFLQCLAAALKRPAADGTPMFLFVEPWRDSHEPSICHLVGRLINSKPPFEIGGHCSEKPGWLSARMGNHPVLFVDDIDAEIGCSIPTPVDNCDGRGWVLEPGYTSGASFHRDLEFFLTATGVRGARPVILASGIGTKLSDKVRAHTVEIDLTERLERSFAGYVFNRRLGLTEAIYKLLAANATEGYPTVDATKAGHFTSITAAFEWARGL